MQQDLHSNATNWIGNTKVVLYTLCQDAVLLGLACGSRCASDNQRWLRVGETVEIEGKPWRLSAVDHNDLQVGVRLHLA